MWARNGAIAAVAIGAVVALVYAVPFRRRAERPLSEVTQQAFQRAAVEANKRLPEKVDDETRLLSVEARGRWFIYHYENTKVLATEVDREEFRKRVALGASARACATTGFRFDSGTAIRYEYVDRLGAELATIDVRASECPEPLSSD